MARRDPAGGSLLGAVLGLGVLAFVAFLVGGMAGLLWKEPGLLLAYLRGDTTEIAWTTAAVDPSPAETPPVAAAPEPAAPEKAQPAAPAAKSPVEAQPAAKSVVEKPKAAEPKRARAVAPPAASGSIAVQVGAFSEREAADRLRQRLRDAGFPAYLAASARAGDPWRVRVGPYGSRGEADRIAGRLKHDQKLPTWVLDENSGP